MTGEWLLRARRVRASAVAIRLTQEGLARAIGRLGLPPPALLREPAAALARRVRAGSTPVFPAPTAVDRAAWRAALGDDERALLADEARAFESGVFTLLGAPFTHGAGAPDWHTDPVTGYPWPRVFFKDIAYVGLPGGTDVKRVWELSRLQWLLPSALLYALDGDSSRARFVLGVVRAFREANPVGYGVHWACTLEPAMRLLVLVHLRDLLRDACETGEAAALDDMIYEHLLFVATFIEYSTVRGNHYVGDLVAIIVGAAAFRGAALAESLLRTAVALLERELRLEVGADGVQYEAATSYHRFVAELAFVGLRVAQRAGVRVGDDALARTAAMASYALAYTRDDGSSPLHGDGDEARALVFPLPSPFDHRYLVNVLELLARDVRTAPQPFGVASALWYFGPEEVGRVRRAAVPPPRASCAFRESGYFVLRNATGDHVFVDAAEVGLAGRGGHGHNDCLSFELALAGVRLLVDGGCSAYSGDVERRKRERATAYHGTPMVAGLEQNELLGLWAMRAHTTPLVASWSDDAGATELVAGHDGYVARAGVRVTRRLRLEHDAHRLILSDTFTGRDGEVTESFVLAPGIVLASADAPPGEAAWMLEAEGRRFLVRARASASVSTRALPIDVGVRYAVHAPSQRLIFTLAHRGTETRFELVVAPTPPP
jgi:hypothetical protein